MNTYPEVRSPFILADPCGAWTDVVQDVVIDGMFILAGSYLRLIASGLVNVYQVAERPY